jgi:hypothetical protein
VRHFWIVAAMALLALLVLHHWRDPLTSCDAIEEGGVLHLKRSGVDTTRARFCYAADCKLMAEQMNKVEQAEWRCE